MAWTWLFPVLALTWLGLGPDWPWLDWLAFSWSQLAMILMSDLIVPGLAFPGSGSGLSLFQTLAGLAVAMDMDVPVWLRLGLAVLACHRPAFDREVGP